MGKKKPHLVIYGTYRCEPVMSERHKDNKVHVVYSGTLDPNKKAELWRLWVWRRPYRLHIEFIYLDSGIRGGTGD